MNFLFLLFCQLVLTGPGKDKIPNSYKYFSGTSAFTKSNNAFDSIPYIWEEFSCAKRKKSFKTIDFYSCDYIETSGKWVINLSINLTDKPEFESCYLNSLEKHIKGNIRTKWESNFSHYQIDSTVIHQVDPSSVVENNRGPLFVFFPSPQMRVWVSVSKTIERKSTNEEIQTLIKDSRDFIAELIRFSRG